MILRFEIDSDKLGEIIENALGERLILGLSDWSGHGRLARACVREIIHEVTDKSTLVAIDHAELPGLLTEELRACGLAEMTGSEEVLRVWAKKLSQAIVREARQPKERVH